ncbi:MAG: hypothetical protein J0L99_07785 [Chitinophagales bacterium]|nr:hypothetical protein [Chitinophagales bacterium]
MHCSISLFRYPASSIVWALSQMQLAHRHLKKAPGLQFYKLMGSGAGNGFSLWPNWRVYSLLGVWESEAAHQDFWQHNPFALAAQRRAEEQLRVHLRPLRTHGTWDGVNPFTDRLSEQPLRPEQAVAVLTRARVRTQRLPEFWRHVPGSSASLEGRPGLKLQIGVGETPLIYQATFSVWDNFEAVQQFAYRDKAHGEVVRKTRDRNWYAEDMFTRFAVEGIEGTWSGRKGEDF